MALNLSLPAYIKRNELFFLFYFLAATCIKQSHKGCCLSSVYITSSIVLYKSIFCRRSIYTRQGLAYACLAYSHSEDYSGSRLLSNQRCQVIILPFREFRHIGGGRGDTIYRKRKKKIRYLFLYALLTSMKLIIHYQSFQNVTIKIRKLLNSRFAYCIISPEKLLFAIKTPQS